MLTRFRLTLAASLAATVLCGCGTAVGSAASPSPSPVGDKKHQFQAVKADCMKQKGFKYVPYVMPEEEQTEEERRRASGDYQAMRKYREKYGFGVFAMLVYPEEMTRMAGAPGPGEVNPNMNIQRELSKAQQEAYTKAEDSCTVTAAKQVLGLTVKSRTDYLAEWAAAYKRAIREMDGDPKLVEPAAAMATCLKGKGYTVDQTKPSDMAEHGSKVFLNQFGKLNRELREDMPTIPPQQARPHLNGEIKAALDDLECGKDFYPVYEPRKSAIKQRIDDQFAFHPQ